MPVRAEAKRYTKSNLPEKICAACGRPFAWRKKWARDWDKVKTCSDRCKGEFRRMNRAGSGPVRGAAGQ